MKSTLTPMSLEMQKALVSMQVHLQTVDPNVSYWFIFKVRLSIVAKKKSCLFVHENKQMRKSNKVFLLEGLRLWQQFVWSKI